MIPKIHFSYLKYYDKLFQDAYRLENLEKLNPYLPYDKLKERVNFLKDIWDKNSKNILLKISEISGLKWKTQIIQVFYIGRCNMGVNGFFCQGH